MNIPEISGVGFQKRRWRNLIKRIEALETVPDGIESISMKLGDIQLSLKTLEQVVGNPTRCDHANLVDGLNTVLETIRIMQASNVIHTSNQQ